MPAASSAQRRSLPGPAVEFGCAIAVSLAAAGAHVVGARPHQRAFDEVRDELGDSSQPGDRRRLADPAMASRLIHEHLPRTLVLCAGAFPPLSPLQDQTWETFSQNWNVDVCQAFHWIREALVRPLAPELAVIAISSGAAIKGSPLSGGYAGEGHRQVHRQLCRHRVAAGRAGNGFRVRTPAVDFGHRPDADATAYAEREGGGHIREVVGNPAHRRTSRKIRTGDRHRPTVGPQRIRADIRGRSYPRPGGTKAQASEQKGGNRNEDTTDSCRRRSGRLRARNCWSRKRN